MNNDFDWDKIDSAAQDAIPLTFPSVFWQHGSSELEEMGEKHWKYRGGLFFISDDDLAIPQWQSAKFKGDKDDVHGYATTSAHVAFIRYRRRWFQDDNGHKLFRPWNQYQPGFRAQMQVIGFIRGYDDPVCFSFKGMVVNYIQNIIKEHYNRIVSVANKTAPEGRKLPHYAIWLTLKSGKFEKAGAGQRTSEVTYPEIVLPKLIDHNYCVERYVGRDNLVRFQDLYHEAEQWAHEWDITSDESRTSAKDVARETQRPNDDQIADNDAPDFDSRPQYDEIPF